MMNQSELYLMLTVTGRKRLPDFIKLYRDKGLETQCLHARGLRFIHPRTGEPIELWTELPDWFQAALSKLGNPLE